MPATQTPMRLDLQKDKHLAIQWQDGRESVYPVVYLRSMCPCAACKQERAERATKKPTLSLKVLSAKDTGEPLAATGAELVGNYAIRLEWSDRHASGIYSFEYLRSIDPVR